MHIYHSTGLLRYKRAVLGLTADSIVTLRYEALDTAASSFSIKRCASNFSSSVGG